MTRLRNRLIAALAGAVLATSAQADVIYDNGTPASGDLNGNDATQWVQAEDFTLAAGGIVTGAGVYIAGINGIGNWDGNFTYYLFASNGSDPGSVLQTGDVSVTPVDTGSTWDFGGNIYLFEFDFLSSFDASVGTTYWLGIHASSDWNRDNIYWIHTGPNGTIPGRESDGGAFDNWDWLGPEHAFYLTDGAGTAVPEPGTWAMMLLGFGAVGVALRRGRKPKLATA